MSIDLGDKITEDAVIAKTVKARRKKIISELNRDPFGPVNRAKYGKVDAVKRCTDGNAYPGEKISKARCRQSARQFWEGNRVFHDSTRASHIVLRSVCLAHIPYIWNHTITVCQMCFFARRLFPTGTYRRVSALSLSIDQISRANRCHEAWSVTRTSFSTQPFFDKNAIEQLIDHAKWKISREWDQLWKTSKRAACVFE